ncbi:MAG: biotin/lipoyl-binding protein, partial [Deltaproteobacteria bacterium]|nr:biotin/lipoyl-binding protein [Deltaproteobacteria bacterium]
MEVVIPEISEGVDEGTVVGILVAKGEVVEEDQSLVELETDKAVVAIPSPASGRVTEILVSEGDTVAVGAVFLHLDAEDESADTPTAEPAGEEPVSEALASGVPRKNVPTPAAAADEQAVEAPTLGEPTSAGEAPAVGTLELIASRKHPAPAAPSVRRVARE